MNILVTGATSFFGRHLVNCLANNPYDLIYATYHNPEKLCYLDHIENLIPIKLEMSEYNQIGNFVDSVDVCYHLAWNGTRGEERDDSNLQIENRKNSIALVSALMKLGLKSLILSGSQAEYGNVHGVIDESHSSNPTTEYGKQKLNTYHDIIQRYPKLCVKEARFFSVYGTGDYEKTLISYCLEKMRKNEDVVLGKCTNIWNYLYIHDAISGLILLQTKAKDSGIYNIANTESIPLREYVEEIKKILDSKSKVIYGSDVGISVEPSISKMIKLGWKAHFSFSDGITDMMGKQ